MAILIALVMPPLLELHLCVSVHQIIAEEGGLHFHLGFLELVRRLQGVPQILEGECKTLSPKPETLTRKPEALKPKL